MIFPLIHWLVLISFSGQGLYEKKEYLYHQQKWYSERRTSTKRGEDHLCKVKIRGAQGLIPVGHRKL